MEAGQDAGALFPVLTRGRLRDMGERQAEVLGRLAPENLVWRPDPAGNSAAHLAVHICGNLRQRVRAAIGGALDVRGREAKFRGRVPETAAEQLPLVCACFAEADAALPAAELLGTKTVRERSQTHMAVLVQGVGHLSEHLGQIIHIAKMRMGDRFARLWTP